MRVRFNPFTAQFLLGRLSADPIRMVVYVCSVSKSEAVYVCVCVSKNGFTSIDTKCST